MENFVAEEDREKKDLSVDEVDEAASELCGLLGCSPEEVRAAVSLTGGELGKALAFLQSVLPSAIAVKGAFEGRRNSDPAGAFCLVAEGASGRQIRLTLWVGYQRLPASFSVEADWEAVKLSLEEIALPPDKGFYRGMEKLLTERLDPTSINRLFRGEESLEAFSERLQEAISNHLRSDVFLRLHLETFNRVRLEQGGLLPSDEEEAKEKPEDSQRLAPATLENLWIRCRPVLDPAKGKALSQIRKGDRLHVIFEDQPGLPGLVAKMMLRSSPESVYSVSSVSKSPAGDYLIELDLSEGVIGVFKQTEDLRVRTASPFSYVERQKLPRRELLFIYLGAGVLLLVFLLLWLLR